mgnify:CR=1 FL=1
MFPDYEPPEELYQALSQAAIVAADIDAVQSLRVEQLVKEIVDEFNKSV